MKTRIPNRTFTPSGRRRMFCSLFFAAAAIAVFAAIGSSRAKAPSLQDNAALGANAYQNQSLSFADRVAYQRAIEDVYGRHRIWPKERPDPKPSLDAVMSQAQLEKKVQDYLRNSQALEDYWQRPISADQLQAEMDRMAQQSKQPEVLHEIFESLGNDPFVIAECLARPVLTERLIADLSAQHETGCLESVRTAELRTLAIATVSGQVAYTLPAIAGPSSSCIDDTWTPTTLTNAPTARVSHTAVWTGSEMIVWGGISAGILVNTGGRYNPSTDSWTATSTINAPTARSGHTAVWTGSEMIVWGASSNTGGRYNPITNSWTATTTTNAPTGRFAHTAVWTGSEMIVWGGCGSVLLCVPAFNTGGRYNPGTDSWTATSTSNAPVARAVHTAVWTGSEMIVWGGIDIGGQHHFNSGGRYNPITNTWTAITTTDAPTGRAAHTAVWTDSEMIVWGGTDNTNNFNTGGKYNPSTNSWTATTTTNAPSARDQHTAVWTDSEMIIWGGSALNTGGRYNPSTNSWTATSNTNAPTGRFDYTAVWTRSEMIVWGGENANFRPLNSGGRYCAAAPVPFTLSAVGRKVEGINTVRLTWDGATSTNVDVYRNGVVIVTTANDGRYVDSTGDTGRAQYTYTVCEAGTQTCSNEVTESFRQ